MIILLILVLIIAGILLGVLIPIIGKNIFFSFFIAHLLLCHNDTATQIATNAFAGAQLNITTMNILNASDTIAVVSILGTIQNTAAFGGTLQPCELSVGVDADSFFGTLQFPSISVGAYGTAVLNFTTDMTVNDIDLFKAFGATLVANATFVLLVSGSTTLVSGGLVLHNIPLQHQISFTGMDGLKDTYISLFDLSSSNNTHINFFVTAEVNNPSSFMVNIGITDFLVRLPLTKKDTTQLPFFLNKIKK